MKKIALVTPWPPQKSGIADYAYDLASQIREVNLEVHIFTSEQNPQVLEGVWFHHVDDCDKTYKELECFESILVQLGNHPHFHGYMLPIIQNFKYKCTIELHDLMLHHLMQGEAGLTEGSSRYYSWLAANYGVEVAEAFQHFFSTDGDILKCAMAVNFPCSDVIVKNSHRVIVHSHFAEERLKRSGVRNISVVNLCLKTGQIISSPSWDYHCFRIGVFGGVQRNRRVDWIIEALNQLGKDIPQWRLDVIGSVDQDCEYLYRLIEDYNMESCITFYGRLPLSAMNEKLEQSDVHIALRSPTMGETSAVVTRSIQLGIPTIVSNIAWYSELPECVIKIDDDFAIQQLTKYLDEFIKNPIELSGLKNQTLSYANNNLQFNKITDDILYFTLGN